MSILQKAVEIASTLDPSLGLELEQEYGADWRGALKSEIAKATAGGSAGPTAREVIRDNEPGAARKRADADYRD